MEIREALLENSDNNYPHIVKKRNFHPNPVFDRKNPREDLEEMGNEEVRSSEDITVELAMFFDQAAYGIFAPFMNYDTGKLRDMLLAYLNGVISSTALSNVMKHYKNRYLVW